MRGTRGYDHDKYRRLVWDPRLVWDLGVKPVIARRGTAHGCWVVERAFAHLDWFRRLRIRYKPAPAPADDIHEAFLTLGCALIRWRRLATSRPQPVPPPRGP